MWSNENSLENFQLISRVMPELRMAKWDLFRCHSCDSWDCIYFHKPVCQNHNKNVYNKTISFPYETRGSDGCSWIFKCIKGNCVLTFCPADVCCCQLCIHEVYIFKVSSLDLKPMWHLKGKQRKVLYEIVSVFVLFFPPAMLVPDVLQKLYHLQASSWGMMCSDVNTPSYCLTHFI